jgi:signal transduction histidine kinase
MLEMLAPQLSSALFKASLYQEAQLFNIKLQKEVEKATVNLKIANKQLEDANEHLQDLDKAKSEFMSIASHQLRTPLTGIMGYLSMILEGDYGKVDKNKYKILKEVFEASQRLIRMVNLFLNITRIEAGRFNFFWQESDIYEIINEQVHELLPNAVKKGLKLELAPAPKGLKTIVVDKDKIKDVILNLVDNAIKYTEKGDINVSLLKKNVKEVEIMVKDTGIGINPQEAQKLFEKFTRGDGMARINPNGSGLGLYVARKMVEGHHGKIWVESEGVGKGSEFHVVLPIKQAQ